MIVSIKIDDLLDWAQLFELASREVRPAIARTLNTVGDQVLNDAIQNIVNATGLNATAVENSIRVEPANAQNLRWRMVATDIMPRERPYWERPWQQQRETTFEQEQLLNIITREDCCEVCEQIASEGPYTVAQINEFAARWAFYEPPTPVQGTRSNLLHPRCRCATTPWQATSRPMEVRFPYTDRPAQRMSVHQLGRQLAEEMKVTIRAIKGRKPRRR